MSQYNLLNDSVVAATSEIHTVGILMLLVLGEQNLLLGCDLW